MTDKQVVLELVQELPDDVSLEEIQEEIAILVAIRKAEIAVKEGQFISHEEVVKRSATWITR